MGKHQTIPHQAVVRAVLDGQSTKEVAFNFGTIYNTICGILNRQGIRRHYLTPAEHAEILKMRRART